MNPLAVPAEEAEQMALFQWLDLHAWHEPRFALAFAIPNGGYRLKATAAAMKATGTKAGVPDVFLPCAGILYRPGHDGATGAMANGLFIELKRVQGGSVAPAQRAWHELLRREGYGVEVCRGWVAAAEVIADYLDRRDIAPEGGR